jgi:hypothetical protein
MKKILLVVLLALSLNAEGIMCLDSEDRFTKHQQLLAFASEREDYYSMKVENNLALKYIERAIASCDYYGEEKEVAAKLRSALMKLNKTLEKL